MPGLSREVGRIGLTFQGSKEALNTVAWPSGKATVCKTVIVGSTPTATLVYKLDMLSLLFAALISNPYPIELMSCYDGDTCTANVLIETKTESPSLDLEVVTTVRLKEQKLRLCNIQAPEIRPLATREVATESRDALLSLLGSARALTVKVAGRDNFGRMLVLLYADGVEVNKKMIDLGYAVPYTPSCEFK